MKKYIIISTLTLLAACGGNSENSNDNAASNADNTSTNTSTTETYTGTLPCADCEGIDVSLELNPDSNYVMTSVYKGSRVDSSNNSFKDSGVWKIYGADTVCLIGKDSSMLTYIKTDSTLTQLDGDKKVITGDIANMFILHKKNN
mgnify:CR=1 FL=1